jgi:S-formylglutathione hydrolase
MKNYFSNQPDEKNKYDCSKSIMQAEKMPPGLVDQGTHDDFIKDMGSENLIEAIGKRGHPIKFRWQDGYNHSFQFITTFIEEHIAFHAT